MSRKSLRTTELTSASNTRAARPKLGKSRLFAPRKVRLRVRNPEFGILPLRQNHHFRTRKSPLSFSNSSAWSVTSSSRPWSPCPTPWTRNLPFLNKIIITISNTNVVRGGGPVFPRIQPLTKLPTWQIVGWQFYLFSKSKRRNRLSWKKKKTRKWKTKVKQDMKTKVKKQNETTK